MSQCDRVLELLADGEWWTTRELLREVPCVVHSRVAELRKRGLEIEHETVGAGAAGSRYRLLSERGRSEGARPIKTGHGNPVPSRSESSLSTFGTEPTSAGMPQAPDATAGATNGARAVPCPDGAVSAASVVRADAPAASASPLAAHPAAGAQLSLDEVAA
jgi:hypothetical protein